MMDIPITLIIGDDVILDITLPTIPHQGDNITIAKSIYKVGSTEFVYDEESSTFIVYLTVSVRKGISMDRPNPILGER